MNQQRVLICCKKPTAFIRAHIWAINRGLTSLLLAYADRLLVDLRVNEFGVKDIITDEPDQPLFQCGRVIDAASLPRERIVDQGLWPDPVAILFTSGSTGAAKPIPKDAKAILGEFALLKEWFRNSAPQTQFISTVPLEHMFGYTFAFWFPYLMEASLHEERPLLPADLKRACRGASGQAWVITTPTHLRSYVKQPGGFDNVAGLICATSPLNAELSRAAVACFNAPITEIYGSTESGVVAARFRTASDVMATGWMPLPGIVLQRSAAGAAIFNIPHIDEPVELSDLIELDGQSFQVLGRTGDMLKICGKRNSLLALNQLLAAVPGVLDSVYFVPYVDSPSETQRATALVVLAQGYSIDDVLSALRGQVDDVFLPRPIHSVVEIPRTEAGKIRHTDLLGLSHDSSLISVL